MIEINLLNRPGIHTKKSQNFKDVDQELVSDISIGFKKDFESSHKVDSVKVKGSANKKIFICFLLAIGVIAASLYYRLSDDKKIILNSDKMEDLITYIINDESLNLMSLEYSEYSLNLQVQVGSENNNDYDIKKYLDALSRPESYNLSLVEGESPDKYMLLVNFSSSLELKNTTNTVIKTTVPEQRNIAKDSLKNILNILFKSPDIVDFKIENNSEAYNLSFPK